MDGEILARGAENREAQRECEKYADNARTHKRTHAWQSNIHAGSHSALKRCIISGGHSFPASAVTFGPRGMASLVPNDDE